MSLHDIALGLTLSLHTQYTPVYTRRLGVRLEISWIKMNEIWWMATTKLEAHLMWKVNGRQTPSDGKCSHSLWLWQGELKSSLRQISTRLINSMFKQSFDCYCKFQRNSDNDMSIQIYQKSLKIYGYAICTLKLIKTHLFTLSRVITDTILITLKDLNAQ